MKPGLKILLTLMGFFWASALVTFGTAFSIMAFFAGAICLRIAQTGLISYIATKGHKRKLEKERKDE